MPLHCRLDAAAALEMRVVLLGMLGSFPAGGLPAASGSLPAAGMYSTLLVSSLLVAVPGLGWHATHAAPESFAGFLQALVLLLRWLPCRRCCCWVFLACRNSRLNTLACAG